MKQCGSQPVAEILLEARDLSFGYKQGAPLFESWSEQFMGGEVCAVTGPSGRGKSTLLYMLGLMLSPSGGDVLVATRPTATLRDSERSSLRASTFGFVFQDSALDPTRSVIDNVTESALYNGQSMTTARSRARDLLDSLSVAVDPASRPGQVSGGQAQRIALCRALLNNPRIILADEPTGNLDASSASLVLDALSAQAARGSAVIIVTHDERVVQACSRRVEIP